jgi:arsenite methyltransferase
MAARKGDYGIDAPYVVAIFAVGALLGAAAFGIGAVVGLPWLASIGVWAFAFDVVCGGSYLYTTRRGKHVVWDRLIGELALGGDETVVDVGCGRGAVLLLAAARVPRGKAIGIDIWSKTDQSGNAEAVTRKNAELEGVSDRVELVTADMRELPLADASADVVVSSLAIHNVRRADERAKAIAEIARVLKPGGRVAIADINFTRAYADELARHSVTATVRGLGPRFWFGGPHVAARLVSGTKR